jgi:hypothetical protein
MDGCAFAPPLFVIPFPPPPSFPSTSTGVLLLFIDFIHTGKSTRPIIRNTTGAPLPPSATMHARPSTSQ